MDTKTQYPSCNVAGGGKIKLLGSENSADFKIINLSAAEIHLKTAMQIEENANVQLKIQLNGILFEVDIDALGKVTSRSPLGNEYVYAIEFTELPEKDREEIDELMRSTCNIEE